MFVLRGIRFVIRAIVWAVSLPFVCIGWMIEYPNYRERRLRDALKWDVKW